MHLLPDLVSHLRMFVAFAVVLGVLVFVHELGHYLAARAVGIRVDVFSIGFGRALVRWTDRHGTVWKVGWLPLGGFVRMHGMERPEDVPEEVRASWVPGETFHEKSVWRRACAVAAGPLANFLLASVVFAGFFVAEGVPSAPSSVLGDVQADSPAARAGLHTGDRVLTIDGAPVRTFEELRRVVSAHPAQELRVKLSRGGTDLELPVLTGEATGENGERIGLLGVRSGAVEYQRVGPVAAVAAGVKQTWTVSGEILSALWNLVTRWKGASDLGGPLRIAQISGQAAELGVPYVVKLIAFLSVNLGLLNLLPIPILDGGHLLFNLVEAVTRRPVPPRVLEYSYRAGLALIAALFMFTSWNDLSSWGLVRWIAGLIG